MEDYLPLIAFLVMMVLVWKLLKGIVKTVALGALLLGVGVFVFGSEIGNLV